MKLSAFADEISPDLGEQIDVLLDEDIRYIDLRSVWNVNVLDLDDRQASDVRDRLADAGIAVAAIGSPLGKVPVDDDFAQELRRLDRAIDLARVYETPFIRVFSFYPPASAKWTSDRSGAFREEAVRRLQLMTDRARGAGMTLLLENDRDLYADTSERCRDVLKSVNQPNLRAAFDPANFIQSGEKPFPGAYEALRPWIGYVHVKDAASDGRVVGAGEGEADWPALLACLRHDGYDGFLSLEPHLAAAGRFKGFSGPGLFRHAVTVFRQLAAPNSHPT